MNRSFLSPVANNGATRQAFLFRAPSPELWLMLHEGTGKFRCLPPPLAAEKVTMFVEWHVITVPSNVGMKGARSISKVIRRHGLLSSPHFFASYPSKSTPLDKKRMCRQVDTCSSLDQVIWEVVISSVLPSPSSHWLTCVCPMATTSPIPAAKSNPPPTPPFFFHILFLLELLLPQLTASLQRHSLRRDHKSPRLPNCCPPRNRLTATERAACAILELREADHSSNSSSSSSSSSSS